MLDQSPVFRHIAVVAHPLMQDAVQEAQAVAGYLQEHGIRTTCGLLNDDHLRNDISAGKFDLVIVLGGDGTMLRAGHACAAHHTPILGINMGRFGFLIEVQQSEWRTFLPRLLQGHYWLEKRMMLLAEHWHGDQKRGQWDVLNEVVVTRGHLIRPVQLTAYLDGQLLTTYVADALLAATPTGSTAYALAAGGPILPPELRNILLVPVAPHLSVDRAIVLAEGAIVSIVVHTDHEATLSVDGQPPAKLDNGDRVNVRVGEHFTQFVRFQDPGYFYRNLTQYMNHNPTTGTSS